MNSKKSVEKRVVLGILLIGIIIASISFVSAKWWIFGEDNGGEGELPQSAAARVKVLDTSAPIVVYVSNTNPDPVTLNNRQLNGGNVSITFWFLAQQGATGSGSLGISSSSSAYFNKTGVSYTRSNSSCVTVGNDIPCGTFCTGTAMNYSCTIVMRYYDNSSIWSINATVLDTATLKTGSNATRTFSVNPLSYPYVITTYLNWTNPVLALSAQNRYSDNNVSISNDGNQPISSASINASGLNGTTYTDEQIPPYKFTVNNVAASGSTCSGNLLALDSKINVPGYNVPKANTDAGSSANFTACLINLTSLIPSLTSQDYNATRLWEIEAV